ncbi:MAG TPA: aldolase [Methanocellales archaeon]|nr:aldolase [Methanocellales archaeon]
MLEEMANFGEKLVEDGLVRSHFGNISVRVDNKMLITKRGAMLDRISEDSVVEVDLEESKSFDVGASMESNVHREIYRRTSALAVIHAHPIYAVVESLILSQDKITPMDCEGLYYLREIPIVEGEAGSKKLADDISSVLRDYKGVIIKGHGTFTTGKTSEEAYILTSMIEHSCKVKYLCSMVMR